MPYSYEDINEVNARSSPTSVVAAGTAEAAYFRKYLFQRASSVIKFNFPEEWAHEWTVANLMGRGYMAVFESPKYGVVAQPCSMRGFDINDQPAFFRVARPLIQYDGRIGKDGFIMRIMPDYSGVRDIINFYANKLAILSTSIDVGLINSRVSMLFLAANKNVADSFKKLYDDTSRGEPAVFGDAKLFQGENPHYEVFTPNVSQNYITDRQLDDFSKIIQMFDTEIGINCVIQTKKANLTTAEVNVNNEEIFTKVDMWIETFNRSVEPINKAFGLNISADWRCKKTGEVQEIDSDD